MMFTFLELKTYLLPCFLQEAEDFPLQMNALLVLFDPQLGLGESPGEALGPGPLFVREVGHHHHLRRGDQLHQLLVVGRGSSLLARSDATAN